MLPWSWRRKWGLHIQKLISGGQSGVDRAALDVALEYGIACGGWCPRGRKAEDGPIAGLYPVQETPSAKYAQRTEWNVRDADGTLILTVGKPTGGTALTHSLAEDAGKPCLLVDLEATSDTTRVRDWLVDNQVCVLNVAGPRESTVPGIYSRARGFLAQLVHDVQSFSPDRA